MRKPGCHEGNQLDGQLRPGAMIGIGFGFAGLVLAFFPLGEALTVAIEPEGNGKGKDFAGRPEGGNNEQTDDDPVVSPTDVRLGSAENDGIMMHAPAINGDAASTTHGVIDYPTTALS